MSKTTVGIDNGPTGSIGILGPDGAVFEPTPTKPCLHYGKKGTKTKRLDGREFMRILSVLPADAQVFIERPFTGKFPAANISAARFYEATIIFLEMMGLGYQTVDSREWQKSILGNVKGTKELKEASRLRGIEMYPFLGPAILKHKDADGLLICRYYHFR